MAVESNAGAAKVKASESQGIRGIESVQRKTVLLAEEKRRKFPFTRTSFQVT